MQEKLENDSVGDVGSITPDKNQETGLNWKYKNKIDFNLSK